MDANDWRKKREAGGCNYSIILKLKEIFLKGENRQKGRADYLIDCFLSFLSVLVLF